MIENVFVPVPFDAVNPFDVVPKPTVVASVVAPAIVIAELTTIVIVSNP